MTTLLTDEGRQNLKAGERVVYRDDFGGEHEAAVRYAPVLLHGHTWVVWLTGMVGCYLLSRVVRRLEG